MFNLRNKCFDKNSEIVVEFNKCRAKVFHDTLSIHSKKAVENCLEPSSDRAVRLLRRNNDRVKFFLINYSPILFINNYMYKGNYKDSTHLMEAFCSSFEEAPRMCDNLEIF